jgi:uncharacterized protein YbjT (DUF2867 family)
MPLGKGSTRLPLVAGEDVARIAAGLLVSPEPWRDKTVSAIAEVLSVGQIADIVSDGLGRPVPYRAVDDAAWRAEAVGREGSGNPSQIEHLAALWALNCWPHTDSNLGSAD